MPLCTDNNISLFYARYHMKYQYIEVMVMELKSKELSVYRKSFQKISILFLTLLLFLCFTTGTGTSAPSNFWFNGTTFNETGGLMDGVNVSIGVYNFTQNGPNLIATYENYSNASGNSGIFNISVNTVGNDYFYKPVIKHFNSTTGRLDYIGQSLPELPAQEIQSISPIDFYLRTGGTINITAVNDTGVSVNFSYMVKDTILGYPIAENFNSEVANATIYVPSERSYSIMIYPNQSFPVSYDLNNLTDYDNNYANITFNTSTLLRRMTGYANLSGGTSNFTNLTIIPFLMEPGDMVFQDHPMPYNMSAWNQQTPGSDTYDATNGTYNITLPGAKMTANLLLFATAYNQTTGTHYGAFKNVSLDYSTDAVNNFNFTMAGLLGTQTNIPMQNADWSSGISTVNITTNKSSFQLKNSTGANISGFAHVEVKVNYSAYNGSTFSWMVDVKQENNGSFSIPALNADIEKINIFTQASAPLKTKITTSQLATQPVSINLTSFNPGAIDDLDTDIGIQMDMFKSTAVCDVPYPATGCSLFGDNGGGEKSEGDFNPFKVVLGGGKISLRMVSSSNITVHYKNVDMLASGPPDAMFDTSGDETRSGSTLDEAWRFGSMGPEIYDEVLVGVPLDSTLNTSNVTVKLENLYDNDWNVIWNIVDNTTAQIPSDYSDFNTTWFNATTGLPCSITNESADCYINTTYAMAWLRIPHFSGIGPSISGFSTFALVSSSSGGSDGTGGDGVTTSEPYDNIEKAERYEKTLSAGKPVSYTFTESEHAVSEIVVTGEENEYDVTVRIEALKSTSSLVSESAPGTVFKNLNIWAGTKKIKEAVIKFKVENSWLDTNNIEAGNVRMVRWSDNEWGQLETTQNTKDDSYTYYKAKTGGFSSFAIVGLKDTSLVPTESEAKVTEVTTPTGEMIPAPIDTGDKESAGFGVMAFVSIMVLMFAIRNKRK